MPRHLAVRVALAAVRDRAEVDVLEPASAAAGAAREKGRSSALPTPRTSRLPAFP